MNKSKSFCEPHDADLMVLIKMVEERPCLWDKSSLKAPGERKQAWREISRHFAPVDFDDMDPAEQSKLVHYISGKWQNLRDTFTKMVKHDCVERYKYYKKMKFYMKNFDEEELLADTKPALRERKSESPRSSHSKRSKRKLSSTISKSTEGTSKYVTDEELEVDIVTPDSEKIDVKPVVPYLPQVHDNHLDEDEAFFISIMPSVKKLSDEDKLEFRMGVLNTIREISQKSRMDRSSKNPCSGFYFVTQDDFPNVS